MFSTFNCLPVESDNSFWDVEEKNLTQKIVKT